MLDFTFAGLRVSALGFEAASVFQDTHGSKRLWCVPPLKEVYQSLRYGIEHIFVLSSQHLCQGSMPREVSDFGRSPSDRSY